MFREALQRFLESKPNLNQMGQQTGVQDKST